MAGLTADLVASIKRRSGMPTAQATYTTAELLAMADEEMMSFISPLVLSVREGYWLRNYDVTLVDGVLEYRIPPTALGNKARDVQLLDANGAVHNIPQLSPSDLEGMDWGFYLQGDRIHLVVDGATTSQYETFTTLRVPYMLRPRHLVDSGTAANFATVSTFSAANKTITLTADPTTWATAATLYDITRCGSPFEVIGLENSATRSGAVLTFTDALPADLAAGDIVTPANASIYPQLPIEMHALLAQKVACQVLRSKQWWDKLKAGEAELATMVQAATALLTPRVEGEIRKVVARSSLYRTDW